ncbi:MAG TPA: TCR/Tet family MFS transporter [Gemmatimonadaceae bacterium]|nr:TCR/Tet family MFS transporter [Gemmatimonadaceae bacterium]
MLRPSRAAFAFIFITVLLDMLALGIIVPVLPNLVVSFEGGDVAHAARIVGLFGFSWAAMQFLASPIVGAMSDRYGRRPLVLLSNFGLGLDYLVMALAPSVPWLLAGRIISGITSSSYSTASAYIADVTPADERAAKFGLLGAAFGLGFIIGPAVGGVLGGISLRLPFYVAGGLSLANAAYGYFILPESLPPEKRARVPWHMANPLGSLTFLRAHPELLALGATYFLFYFAHEIYPTLFVLFGEYRYGWTVSQLGLTLAFFGVGSTIASAFFIGPIVKRVGERNALLLGLGLAATSSMVIALAYTGTLFLISIPIASLGGLTTPSLMAIASRQASETEQGRLQGALGSLQGIAMMIAPLVLSEVFAVSIQRGGKPFAGVPFAFVSLVLCLALFLAARATNSRPVPVS